MKWMILAIGLAVLAGCGTISSQDYTDAKVEAAIAQAKLDAAADAGNQIERDAESIKRAIELWLLEQGFLDGRRPHRPGGA